MNKKAYDLETVPLACMTMLIVFLDFLMLVAAPEAATSLPKSKPLVAFENERLSVQAGEVPLKDLLSEIQAKSGIVIELKDSEAAAKLWSVDFKTLPPVLALRLLATCTSRQPRGTGVCVRPRQSPYQRTR